jgi:hypothetical protein
MAATDNLTSLHKREEELRAGSLGAIGADAALSDEAMNAIWAFTHDHVHGSEDELTLQLLGIRLFNAAGSSIRLAMAGYYQGAFAHVRDVIETSFLIDYFTTFPAEIAEWRQADKRKRMSRFGAGRIRTVLDKRAGYTSGERKRIYDTISEYATHASYPGVTLITTGPENMAQVGPFFDERKLRSWLGEMAMRLSHAAMVLLPNPDGSDRPPLIEDSEVVRLGRQKYRGMKPQAGP